MTEPVRGNRRPFTVVACTACAADGGSEALDALRETVRRCDHAVLVTTGCLRDVNACPSPLTCGVTLVLQPCSVDRRPSGPGRWLGPVEGAERIGAVCEWLARGDWDAPRC